jgi:hypothetical protein
MACGYRLTAYRAARRISTCPARSQRDGVAIAPATKLIARFTRNRAAHGVAEQCDKERQARFHAA